MPGSITVAAVQATPLAMEGLPVFGRSDTVAEFAADVMRVRETLVGPALIVYPEIHLFGTDDTDSLAKAAEPLDGPLIAALGEVARAADAWLVPGSVLELGDGGELFNTATVFAPDGRLAGSYRKISRGARSRRSRPETRSSPSTSPTSAASGCPSATTPGSQN